VEANRNETHQCEELRKEFVSEFHRTKQVAHVLVDDLTVISGYAEIMLMRGGPEQTQTEFRKILARATKSLTMLQECITNLQDVGRRHS